MSHSAPRPVIGPEFQGPEHFGWVSLKEYFDRVFDEKDKQSQKDAAKVAEALIEAKQSTKEKLDEAKTSADNVTEQIQKRIELLESGGAPFASRLDESLSQLKLDVDVLKENMVRTTVLDALREQTVAEQKAQKRQIRYIAIAAAVSFALSGVLVLLQILSHHIANAH